MIKSRNRNVNTGNWFAALGITAIVFWIIGVIGYMANIIQIIMFALGGKELSLLVILKIIGVFVAPFGSLMGLIGFIW
jgi:uncharacterized membrane-anchored protein